MPRAVKKVATKKVVEKTPEVFETPVTEATPAIIEKHGSKIAIGFLALVILVIFAFKNKGLFVVATVNNMPITRLEMENRINAQYGKQVVDQMVNEKIIRLEAQKQGINVTTSEIDSKVTEISKVLEGKMTLEQALAQQGMTLADFKSQIEMQIIAEKLASKDVVVTDADVDKYIADNKAYMTATEAGAQKTEAYNTLKQQKTADTFNKIFTDLKSKANVVKF